MKDECQASIIKAHLKKQHLGLQLFYTNVCGPIILVSLGENKYFLIFIDDYGRKTWVYLFKNKSKIFCCFKKFKAFLENSYYLKTLRPDRGGEFISMDFTRFCEEHGFRRQLTTS